MQSVLKRWSSVTHTYYVSIESRFLFVCRYCTYQWREVSFRIGNPEQKTLLKNHKNRGKERARVPKTHKTHQLQFWHAVTVHLKSI